MQLQKKHCLSNNAIWKSQIKVLFPVFLQICVLLFVCLYMVSYLILTHFRKAAEFVTGKLESLSPLGV